MRSRRLSGYVSARYGTSGIEDAYDRALTPADTTGDPVAQFDEILSAFEGKSSQSHGADVVTTIVPSIERTLWDQLSRHARGAGIMDGQAKLAQPFRECHQQVPCVVFVPAPDHQVSRPTESHRQALAQPDVRLSPHPASRRRRDLNFR